MTADLFEVKSGDRGDARDGIKQIQRFDVVRLVSGEEVCIVDVLPDGWFSVEFDCSDGCSHIETVNRIEIDDGEAGANRISERDS